MGKCLFRVIAGGVLCTLVSFLRYSFKLSIVLPSVVMFSQRAPTFTAFSKILKKNFFLFLKFEFFEAKKV